LQKVAEATKLIIVPEMNMGKYSREVERALKDKIVVSMPKCGGDIHTPKEILDRILEEVGIHESRV
jgi:2-oxoglutarate/2-oxoacid ferredoxin oxidoreductase subunit alpha